MSRPLRICLVTREYAEDTPLGGIGRAMNMQARALAMTGAEVHVITRAPVTRARYTEHGVTVHRVAPPTWRATPDMGYIGNAAWAKAFADAYADLDARIGFDVVDAPDYAAEALHLPVRPETRLVVTLHGPSELLARDWSDDPATPGDRASYAMEAAAMRRADLLIAPSAIVRDEVVELLRGDAPPAELVPFALDADRFPARTRHAVQPGVRRLVYLGRLERLKGVDFAMRAAAAAERRGLDVELVLVGRDNGGYKGKVLEPLARELGLRNWSHVPEVGAGHVAELLREFDCAILPSRRETFHMASAEALSSGVPVITSDRVGLTTWLGAEHGLLGLPLEDADRFAELAADALEDDSWLIDAGARGAAAVRELLAPATVGARRIATYAAICTPDAPRDAAAPSTIAAPLEPPRRIKVAADATELATRPDLAGAYAAMVGPADDATLILTGRTADAAAALAAFGDQAPHVLIADGPLPGRPTAVLTEAPDDSDAPVIGVRSASRLRELLQGAPA